MVHKLIAFVMLFRIQQTVTPVALSCLMSVGMIRLALHAPDACWLSPRYIRYYHHLVL